MTGQEAASRAASLIAASGAVGMIGTTVPRATNALQGKVALHVLRKLTALNAPSVKMGLNAQNAQNGLNQRRPYNMMTRAKLSPKSQSRARRNRFRKGQSLT